MGLVIANGRIVILAYRIFGNSNRQGWGVTTGSSATLVGSIVNATCKKLFFPPGLSQQYCANFLDTGEACKFGFKYNFKHWKLPKDFPFDGIASMMDLLSKTRGISWNPVLRLQSGFRE